MTFIIGIDDAGRGPLIGPMFLAGVLLDENQKKFLQKYNIKDSKQLIHSTRIQLSKVIEQTSLSYKVVSSSPEEIDKAVNSKMNLNTLEAIKMAEIINFLNDKKKKIKVIVDCPSINTSKFKSLLTSYIENPENLTIKCEHKADENYIEAAAASILAKVAREEAVSKLKSQYGNIGSGYPSDPYTQEFLKNQGKKLSNSGIFRKSWKTWTSLFPEDKIDKKKQKLLSEF